MLDRGNTSIQLTIPLEWPFRRRSYILMKRMFDIVVSLIGIIVLAPLMLVIAIALWLDSPGPILLKQQRIGQWGRPFVLYRFRTMIPVGEWPLADVQVAIYKMGSDPRVTMVGRLLRRLSLDELPQLFNVIRGEMSLVGPRPALPYELEQYTEEALLRLQMKPGMTGLWQVSMMSTKYCTYEEITKYYSYEEMMRLELEYVRHASLWMDLKILFKTLIAALQAKGAY